jgi:ABC-type oligopeptide transport system substrate-binding subunit
MTTMISNRKSRPLLAIAAVAAVAAMVAGCNSGSGGSQGGYVAPANGGYVNTNPNLPASMSWENTAQQNGYNAINDENYGGDGGGGGGDDSGD